MLLCQKIDLDLEKESEVYANAVETIAYLEDIKKSIESRVLSGEKIHGLGIVEGKKTRTITEEGYIYLSTVLGRDKIYKVEEKPIGIGELEKLVDGQQMFELQKRGFVQFTTGKPKVSLL